MSRNDKFMLKTATPVRSDVQRRPSFWHKVWKCGRKGESREISLVQLSERKSKGKSKSGKPDDHPVIKEIYSNDEYKRKRSKHDRPVHQQGFSVLSKSQKESVNSFEKEGKVDENLLNELLLFTQLPPVSGIQPTRLRSTRLYKTLDELGTCAESLKQRILYMEENGGPKLQKADSQESWRSRYLMLEKTVQMQSEEISKMTNMWSECQAYLLQLMTDVNRIETKFETLQPHPHVTDNSKTSKGDGNVKSVSFEKPKTKSKRKCFSELLSRKRLKPIVLYQACKSETTVSGSESIGGKGKTKNIEADETEYINRNRIQAERKLLEIVVNRCSCTLCKMRSANTVQLEKRSSCFTIWVKKKIMGRTMEKGNWKRVCYVNRGCQT